MGRRRLPVQTPLDGNGAVFRDGKLPPAVRASVDHVADLGVSAFVRVGGAEPLQGLAHPGILSDHRLNVGLFKDRLVVVDVAQFHHHPRVGHVIPV